MKAAAPIPTPAAATPAPAKPQWEPCARCGRALEFTLDPIGRVRGRCPRCDGVAPKQAHHPDEVLVPQTLVAAARALPPIAPGQLRCQRCARGVRGHARFCSPACRDPERPAPRPCARCGARFLPTRRNQSRCDPCRHPAPTSHRTYARKPCARCAARFTPTGPHAKYCPRCRAAAA